MTHRPTLEPLAAGSLRILHVDDDAVNLLAMDHMLRALGHLAVGAPSGAEALARLENATFDLILSDIHMPQMDGVDLLRHVQARRSQGDAPPVVAVTADVMTRTAATYRELGFAGAIAKPLLIPALMQVIAAAAAAPEQRAFAAVGLVGA